MTKSRTYSQPLTLISPAQPRNGVAKTFENIHRGLNEATLCALALALLVTIGIQFADLTDPRPVHGTRACQNAQEKAFDKHMKSEHSTHLLDATELLAQTCK